MPTPGTPTISMDLEFHARIFPLSWTMTEVPIVACVVFSVFVVVATTIGVITALLASLAAGIVATLVCMGIRKSLGPSYLFDVFCVLGWQGDEYGILGVHRRVRTFTAEPVPEWSGFRGARRDLGTIDVHDLAFPILGFAAPLSCSGAHSSRVVSVSASQRLDHGDPVGRMLGRRRHL